jgi:carbon storage regulator CsrA
MLVLSRRCQDSIHFPELDIKIEILQVKGSAVRVGVDAPLEIKVLRGELVSDEPELVAKKILVSAEDDHEVRNKLNHLSIASGLAKKLLANGKTRLAATTLDEALTVLQSESTERPKSDSQFGRALLVEDAPNEREMLAGFLRLHGYHVDTTGDGAEALQYLENNDKPDFILMDMQLPVLDGPSAIRKIRENVAFDNVEIFAVSGKTARSAGVDVGKNRVAKWFQKPLQPGSLISSINSHFVEKVGCKSACN